MKSEIKLFKDGQVSVEDGRVLQLEGKAQKVPHQRPHPTKGPA